LEVAVIKLSKKQGVMIALSALVAGMSVAGCSTTTETPGAVDTADNTGKVGLNLTLSNGVVINQFTATITGDALAAPIVRNIPVPNNGATVSALFGGLPAGDYEIELTATSVDGHSDCGGSAEFTVIAQTTVGVSVPITCNTDSIRGQVTVEGELNVCPDVDFLFVAPLQTAVGGPISVEAHASDSDGDTITYAWSATDGSFAAATAASTTYTCSAPGEQTITVAINDGGSCTTMHQQVVNCEPTAVCGDGLLETDKGEECESATGTPATPVAPDGILCSVTCQDIDVACGNSIEQPGEECDPPNGKTCNQNCQDITCGDSSIEGTEQCDPPGPPGAGNCTASCQTIPSVCPNGIKEPGEACDDGAAGSATCSPACVSLTPDFCAICQTASCAGPKASVTATCTGTTCNAYNTCRNNTNCDANGDSRVCYCGTPPGGAVKGSQAYEDFMAACFGAFSPSAAQAGVCKSQIETLAGTNVPIGVGTGWFDPATPLGALNQLSDCSATNCFTPPASCFQ
jgi:methionine-rich copper-binding protein CopC